MDRKKILKSTDLISLYEELLKLHGLLEKTFHDQLNRSLPFADELLDRWERAKRLNFGDGSSIYDSSYVFGDVKVGKNTWIGPFTIIDGSGELSIGDNCTISSGVHIYSHDNIAQTLTNGKASVERKAVKIGHCTYIGPNSVITKGIEIGDHCLVGTGTFVNRNIPSNSIVVGTPGKIIGTIIINGDKVLIEYYKNKSGDEMS